MSLERACFGIAIFLGGLVALSLLGFVADVLIDVWRARRRRC